MTWEGRELHSINHLDLNNCILIHRNFLFTLSSNFNELFDDQERYYNAIVSLCPVIEGLGLQKYLIKLPFSR